MAETPTPLHGGDGTGVAWGGVELQVPRDWTIGWAGSTTRRPRPATPTGDCENAFMSLVKENEGCLGRGAGQHDGVAAGAAARRRAWPTADVLAIFRFHDDEVVDFDTDLRELQGQERLDVLCGFLREIGRRLGKRVLMGAEGADGHSILGSDVESDRVVLLVER